MLELIDQYWLIFTDFQFDITTPIFSSISPSLLYLRSYIDFICDLETSLSKFHSDSGMHVHRLHTSNRRRTDSNFPFAFFILLLRQCSIINVIWNCSPGCTILVVRAYLNCANNKALLAVDNNIVINMTGSCFIISIFSLLNICVHLTFYVFS